MPDTLATFHEEDWFETDYEKDITWMEKARQKLRRFAPEDHAVLSNKFERAQNGRRQLLVDNAGPYEDRCDLVSEVTAASDLFDLVNLMEEASKGKNDYLRFEIRCLFGITLALFELWKRDHSVGVRKDFADMLGFLGKNLFDSETESIDVWSRLDAENEYRVTNVRFGRPYPKKGRDGNHHIQCRPTRFRLVQPALTKHHEKLRVLFKPRLKIETAALFKILHQSMRQKRNPTEVLDRIGFHLITQDEEATQELFRVLNALFKKEGIEIIDEGGSLKGGQRMDETNKHSSPEFNALKYFIRWKDRHYELMIMSITDYFNAKFSIADLNHDLYELKKCLDFFFPKLYPKDIYGIDWSDPRVADRLRRWKISRQESMIEALDY